MQNLERTRMGNKETSKWLAVTQKEVTQKFAEERIAIKCSTEKDFRTIESYLIKANHMWFSGIPELPLPDTFHVCIFVDYNYVLSHGDEKLAKVLKVPIMNARKIIRKQKLYIINESEH